MFVAILTVNWEIFADFRYPDTFVDITLFYYACCWVGLLGTLTHVDKSCGRSLIGERYNFNIMSNPVHLDAEFF